MICDGVQSLTAKEHASIVAAKSVYQFDDDFIGPRHGFAGADDYYARCSAIQFLNEIRIPTLILNARDDPWIPSDALEHYMQTPTPTVRAILPHRGGHVGFHGRGERAAWHDVCAQHLFEEVSFAGR